MWGSSGEVIWCSQVVRKSCVFGRRNADSVGRCQPAFSPRGREHRAITSVRERTLSSPLVPPSREFLWPSRPRSTHLAFLNICTQIRRCSPGSCDSVGWASPCDPKSQRFNSRSGLIPRLQVWSLVGAHTRGS